MLTGARALLVAVAAAGVAVGVGAPGAAHAQGLDLAGVGARGIARAGAIVVSVDDGAALWVNPSGLARRSVPRAQLGLFLTDRGARYASSQAFQSDPATEEDRQGGELGFWAGAQAAVGDRVVLGAAYLEPTRLSLAAARPVYERPDPSDDFRYPGRYGGTRLELFRRAVAVGASVRLLPSLAAGVSLLALQTTFAVERTVFGGGADDADPDFRNPNLDLALAVEGRDPFVPGAAAGLLLAPESVPVELAGAVSWIGAADLDGAPTLAASRGPAGGPPRVRALVDAGASAQGRLPGALTARLGARSTLGPIGVELVGEATFPQGAPRDFALQGVAIETDTDGAALDVAPLPVRPRRTLAARVAVDATLASGALTLSVGWAYAQGALAPRDLTPGLPELDAHTIALGAEGHVGRATVTLGVSRTLGLARTVAETDTTTRATAPLLDDPPAAAAGSYDASATLVGLGVELDLE